MIDLGRVDAGLDGGSVGLARLEEPLLVLSDIQTKKLPLQRLELLNT